MKDFTKNRIDTIIQNGYKFKFGDYLEEAFKIMNKNAGGFIGYFILLIVLVMAMFLLGPLIIFANFILLPFFVGFYIVANKIQEGKSHEFGDFFKGFNHFGSLAIMILISFFIYLIAMIPVFWYWWSIIGPVLSEFSLGELDSEGYTELGIGIVTALDDNSNSFISFLTNLPTIYLSVAWQFGALFIIFYNYSPWQALEASRKLITKKWILFLLYGIVLGVIGGLGFLAIIIGALYTIPVALIGNYVVFSDVTQLNRENDESQSDLLDHLVG